MKEDNVTYSLTNTPKEAGESVPDSMIFWKAILFGGDRIACCDEAILVVINSVIIGAATIAPKGESCEDGPEIVGVFVRPEYRRQGIGKKLINLAIDRCLERGLGKPTMVPATDEGQKLINALHT